MTKLKKGAFAAFAAVIAATGVTAAVISHRNAIPAYAAETEEEEVVYHLRIEDNILYGFSEGLVLEEDVDLVVPEGVTEIAAGAFKDDLRILSVLFPDTVEIISESAFESCWSLQEIVLPSNLKNVGKRAFYDCSSLGGTLTIPAGTEKIGDEAFSGEGSSVNGITDIIFGERSSGSRSLSIGYRAFAGSGELSVLTVPEGISSIGLQAFCNCDNLRTVYLNTVVDFEIDAPEPDVTEPDEEQPPTIEIKYFNEETLIVSKNYQIYRGNADSLPAKQPNQTYAVKITFDGGFENGESGGKFECERLAGKSLNYVKNEDGSWSEVDFTLPVQDGYSYSRWYADENYYQPVNDADINQVLEDLLVDPSAAIGGESLTYYAKYIAKPQVATQTLPYGESAHYTAEDFIEGTLTYGGEEIFAVSLVGVDDGTVLDAGDYTLEISLTDVYGDYGAWAEPLLVTVTVDRKSIEFPDDVTWQSSGNDLTSGSVYVYKNGDDRIYSYSVIKNPPAGYTLNTVLPLTNSIVRYKNRDITLNVNDTDKYYTAKYTDMQFNGVAEPDGDNTESAVGRYEAKALLEAVDNYKFLHGGETVTTSATHGVTITISEDGISALVTKVWYILDLGNELVFEGTDDSYTISGWRYKEGTAIPAPAIAHTDEDTEANTVFTLVKDGSLHIGGSHHYSQFAEYVNASMPAGSYTLTFEVPDIIGESGDMEYAAFSETYNFTVTPARFEDEWKEDLPAHFHDSSARYTGGIALNGDNEKLTLWSEEVLRTFNPERTGVWAEGGVYDYLYSDRYGLKYNLARMQTTEYYPFTEISNRNDLFKPVNPDTYIIYYQFEANNYEPLVNINDDAARRSCRYQLIIFDLLEAPKVETMEYTGLRVLPYVAESPLYKIIYDEDERSYIDATRESWVKLEIFDTVHYKWKVNGEMSDDKTYTLTINITRAKNSESVSLSMAQWLYGNYSPDVHVPVWGTYFSDPADKDFYSFKLVDKDGREYTDFSEVGVGTYTLVATAKGYKENNISTVRYNWEEFTQSIPVIIEKGIIGWSVTPNVMQWRFGGYNASVNLVLGETDRGNAVKFKITSDKEGENVIAGLEEFTADNGVVAKEVGDVLSTLKVGAYYLWASVEATDFYEGLNPEPLEFAVTIAQNYWEEAPSIVTWIEGKYDADVNVITSVSHFGSDITPDVVITVAGDAEAVIYDNVNGINLLSQAKVGAYELRATLAGTDNYTDLTYSFTFQVFEKEGLAWWIVLLIVVGTVGVLALILFILHQKGVLQLLTGRFVLAMRARATVDATIAAVRANKVAENAKISVEKARLLSLEEEKQRKQEAIAALPEKDKAEILALTRQAKTASEQAEQLSKKAGDLQQQADDLLQRAGGNDLLEKSGNYGPKPVIDPDEKGINTSDKSSDEE